MGAWDPGRVWYGSGVDESTDEAPHPFSFFTLPWLIPTSSACRAHFGKFGVHLLMHHAKVASAKVSTPQLEELSAMDVEALERFLPVPGETVHLEPGDDFIKGP